jgi:hypothetical protein
MKGKQNMKKMKNQAVTMVALTTVLSRRQRIDVAQIFGAVSVLVLGSALSASAQTPTPPSRMRSTVAGHGSATAQPTPTRTQPPSGLDTQMLNKIVLPGYNYSLEITDIQSLGPATVEHEPMEVSYTLTITTYGRGEFPELRRLKICPREQVKDTTTCKEINSPRVRRRYTGKVRALAPVAGAASPMTLVVLMEPPTNEQYGQWTEVAETRKNISVAARYEVSIESFETLHTRSTTSDTACMNLQAIVKTQPPHPSDREDACNVEGMNWCKVGFKYGDVQDGVHPVTDVRVGPYLLTPEHEKELSVLYNVYNHGKSRDQQIGEAVANGFSKVGMIILTGTTGSEAAPALDKGMQSMHESMFADCDGLMAVGNPIISNRMEPAKPNDNLDAYTRGTGVHSSVSGVYEGNEYQDGNTVCGAGGKYKVTYAIYRTSWRPPTP